MKPPRNALLVVVVVAAVFAATLLLTNGGVRGGSGLPRLLVDERDLASGDLVSYDCRFDVALRIDPGETCRITVGERFRTTRRVSLRLDEGAAIRVVVQPADSRELTAERTVGTGEVTSGLTVSSAGGDVVVTCDGVQQCVVTLA